MLRLEMLRYRTSCLLARIIVMSARLGQLFDHMMLSSDAGCPVRGQSYLSGEILWVDYL